MIPMRAEIPIFVTRHAVKRYRERVNGWATKTAAYNVLVVSVRDGFIVGRDRRGRAFVTMNQSTPWRAVVREDRGCLVVVTVLHGVGAECERRAA